MKDETAEYDPGIFATIDGAAALMALAHPESSDVLCPVLKECEKQGTALDRPPIRIPKDELDEAYLSRSPVGVMLAAILKIEGMKHEMYGNPAKQAFDAAMVMLALRQNGVVRPDKVTDEIERACAISRALRR